MNPFIIDVFASLWQLVFIWTKQGKRRRLAPWVGSTCCNLSTIQYDIEELGHIDKGLIIIGYKSNSFGAQMIEYLFGKMSKYANLLISIT